MTTKVRNHFNVVGYEEECGHWNVCKMEMNYELTYYSPPTKTQLSHRQVCRKYFAIDHQPIFTKHYV